MFRCEKCDRIVAAGVAAEQLIIKRRRRDYPARTREATAKGRRYQRVETIDKGGEGHEIVRELKVCPECAREFADD